MKILSVNVGLPRDVLFGKEIVTTGIFKEPVEGPIKLRKLNRDGDKQARAWRRRQSGICISPGALRGTWQRELPNTVLPWKLKRP